jgi:hypothetical protein
LHSGLHSEGLNHSSALFPTSSAPCIPRGRIRNCNADNGYSCFCSVPFRGGWEQILRHDDGARCDQSRAIIAFTTGPDTEDFPHFAGRIVNMLCQVSHRPTSNNFNQPGLLMDNLSRGTTRDWFSLSASQDENSQLAAHALCLSAAFCLSQSRSFCSVSLGRFSSLK